jgi:hypothetical protein
MGKYAREIIDLPKLQMSSLMIFLICTSVKSLITSLAFVGFLICVDSHVDFEIGPICEKFIAVRASVAQTLVFRSPVIFECVLASVRLLAALVIASENFS